MLLLSVDVNYGSLIGHNSWHFTYKLMTVIYEACLI